MAKFLDENGLLYFFGKIKTLLGMKVDKVSGKGLSTNDYTTTEKNKLAGVANNANNYAHPTTPGNKHVPGGGAANQILRYSADGTAAWSNEKDTVYAHPTGDGNQHVPATGTTHNGQALIAGPTAGSAAWKALTKAMVGLGNADNTSDLNKPVSNAVQAALLRKLSVIDHQLGVNEEAPDTLGDGIHVYADGLIVSYDLFQYMVAGGLCKKRSKSGGTWGGWTIGNDYSDSERRKLADIEENANHYVLPDLLPASMILTDDRLKFVSTQQESLWNAKAGTDVATQSLNGLMAAADKKKLDGVAAGANNYAHPTAPGSRHVPAGGESGQMLLWSADGSADWSDAYYTVTADDRRPVQGRAVYSFVTGQLASYALKEDVVGTYKYKGSVADATKLPATGQRTGDVYNIAAPSAYGAAGANVAWDGGKWDSLGEVFTITSMSNSDIDAICV